MSTDTVLTLLRQLPPRERLRVIAQVLSETECELSDPRRPLQSLRGLWKDLDFDISAEQVDRVRREAWPNSSRANTGGSDFIKEGR